MISHIDASLSRQPLVKGERLVRYEVNAVIPTVRTATGTYQNKTDEAGVSALIVGSTYPESICSRSSRSCPDASELLQV